MSTQEGTCLTSFGLLTTEGLRCRPHKITRLTPTPKLSSIVLGNAKCTASLKTMFFGTEEKAHRLCSLEDQRKKRLLPSPRHQKPAVSSFSSGADLELQAHAPQPPRALSRWPPEPQRHRVAKPRPRMRSPSGRGRKPGWRTELQKPAYSWSLGFLASGLQLGRFGRFPYCCGGLMRAWFDILA